MVFIQSLFNQTVIKTSKPGSRIQKGAGSSTSFSMKSKTRLKKKKACITQKHMSENSLFFSQTAIGALLLFYQNPKKCCLQVTASVFFNKITEPNSTKTAYKIKHGFPFYLFLQPDSDRSRAFQHSIIQNGDTKKKKPKPGYKNARITKPSNLFFSPRRRDRGGLLSAALWNPEAQRHIRNEAKTRSFSEKSKTHLGKGIRNKTQILISFLPPLICSGGCGGFG